MTARHRLRGSTIIEVSVAAMLTALVMGSGLGIFIYGMTSFYKGQTRLDSQANAQVAIRRVSYELREASSVTLDSNGQGITYVKASTDSSGNVIVPLVSDGVSRRIYLSGSTLILTAGSVSRNLCYNVTTTDPNTGSAYQIFTPGTGSVIRSVTIMLATQTSTTNYGASNSRARETIYLRNVPDLSR